MNNWQGMPGFQGASVDHPMHFQQGFENARNITPISFHPTSVLHPVALSPNGLGTNDSSRRLYGGGLLPTSNGQSKDTYKATAQFNPFRQIGQ